MNIISLTTFYHQISSVMPTFIDNNDEDKLNLLTNKEHVNLFSRYICYIYKIRQDILFKENVWQMCTPCGLDMSHLCIILCRIYSCVVLYKMFTLLLIKYTYIHILLCVYIPLITINLWILSILLVCHGHSILTIQYCHLTNVGVLWSSLMTLLTTYT